MKTRRTRWLLCAALLWAGGLSAVQGQPSPDTATCAISGSVSEIMEWAGNFPPITLAAITSQSQQATGTAALVLYTNGDVDITADNTATARLVSGGGATLTTEYSLAYDGNGVAATGGDAVAYTAYNLFLASASRVTHVTNDGAVEVTLGVRASNPAGNVAEADSYTATQTLTATWVP